MTTQSPIFSDVLILKFHVIIHGYAARTKSIIMLYTAKSQPVRGHVPPKTTLTISAFLEVIEETIVEAEVQSNQVEVLLHAAGSAPFEQDLKMISTYLDERNCHAYFLTFIKL